MCIHVYITMHAYAHTMSSVKHLPSGALPRQPSHPGPVHRQPVSLQTWIVHGGSAPQYLHYSAIKHPSLLPVFKFGVIFWSHNLPCPLPEENRRFSSFIMKGDLVSDRATWTVTRYRGIHCHVCKAKCVQRETPRGPKGL